MKGKRLSVLLFYLLLAAIPTATLLTATIRPEHEKSHAISLSSTLSGAAAEEAEAVLAKNFPAKDFLTSLRTQIELSSGRKEIDGVFVLPDRLIENTPAVSEKAVTHSAEIVSAFAERFDGAISLMLVPTASSIHRDLLPATAEIAAQKALIDKAYELVSEQVGTIDCYSTLSASRDLSLYYRTDPRWTSLGAYMGYSACSNQMGFSPLAMDRFNIEHANHNYFGLLCDRIGYYDLIPDTIDIYSAPESDTNSIIINIYNKTEWIQTSGLYNRERLDEGYAVFPEGAPVSTIETGMKKAPRLLIVGDSFVNALAPFLTMHYSTVTVADMALSENELRQLIDVNSYDQILFCCTLNSFAELQ